MIAKRCFKWYNVHARITIVKPASVSDQTRCKCGCAYIQCFLFPSELVCVSYVPKSLQSVVALVLTISNLHQKGTERKKKINDPLMSQSDQHQFFPIKVCSDTFCWQRTSTPHEELQEFKDTMWGCIASPQTSFGVRLSHIPFSLRGGGMNVWRISLCSKFLSVINYY